MELTHVNVAVARPIDGLRASTGIFKVPVDGPVELRRDGVAGDAVCNRKHHGGPDQAVYVYGGADTAWWEAQLGRPLPPGAFGENLTVAGLETGPMRVGDRLRVGAALLEVTAPRIPCNTLARRMEDPGFVEVFLKAGRPGVYCRVLEEGAVAAGDPVTVEPFAGDTVTVLEVVRDYVRPNLRIDAIRRFLAAPVSERFRARKERHLEAALSKQQGGGAS